MTENRSNVPFRWDLVTPDQLGSLLAGTEPPDLWFLEALTECAGRVLARSGNGDLVFVGRSLDSMFDLLGGVLAGRTEPRLLRLPFSFQRPAVQRTRKWRRRPLTATEVAQARHELTVLGLTPHALARRERPVTFVDVVNGGDTFTELFHLLHGWVDDERETWPAIRRKMRFTGVTIRRATSPNTDRCQQHAAWIRRLPARSVLDMSQCFDVWSYLVDYQVKLTRSFRPERWLAEAEGPRRDDRTRQALAEAAALVAHGRSRAGRQAVGRAIGREPTLAEPWLRTLVSDLTA